VTDLHPGYEVVCPDGKVRVHPYHNEGDAECDAEVYEERGCVRDPIGEHPLCPGGRHRVRPILMACPEHVAKGEA